MVVFWRFALKLLLIEDHPLVQIGIKSLFKKKNWSDVKVVSSSEEIESSLECHSIPDLVITDIMLPNFNVFEILLRLDFDFTTTKLIVLSAFLNESNIKDSIKLGANGIIAKGDSMEEIENGIDIVINGQNYTSPSILINFKGMVESRGLSFSMDCLTPREKEILTLLAKSQSIKEISHFLSISVKTVDKHRSNLMRKLDIHTQTELVRYAIRVGLAKA